MSVAVAATGGSNTLSAATGPNQWAISGANAGNLNGQVTFTGISSLTGAPGFQDTFTVQPGGQLTSAIAGQTADGDSLVTQILPGATTQTVVLGSGTLSEGGVPVAAYSGLSSAQNIAILSTTPTAPGADQFVLSPGSAGNLVLTSGNGAFQAVTFTSPTNSIQFDPSPGANSFTINAGGIIAPVTINEGPNSTDSLILGVQAGGTAQTVSFSNATVGAGSVSVGSLTISYTGVSNPQNLVVSGTAGADSIQLANAAGGQYAVKSTNGGFQPVTFSEPSGSLTILGGAGADSIDIPASVTYTNALTLDGQGGANSVTIEGTLGSLSLNANDSTITSTGTIANLTFTETSTANGDNINIAAGGGNITISDTSSSPSFTTFTVPAPTTSLTLNGGSGNNDTFTSSITGTFAPTLYLVGGGGTNDTTNFTTGTYNSLHTSGVTSTAFGHGFRPKLHLYPQRRWRERFHHD